ncbi:hypothetical protein GTW43_25405, partial [Streptomyces sp. SID5785]
MPRTPAVAPDVAALFLPAPLPREGRIALWAPDGSAPPGAGEEITVVRPHGTGVRSRTVPALVLPVTAALPLLLAAR